MKEINKSMILDLVRRKDAISRAEIAKELRLSPPTVSKIIDQLISSGWILEIGTGESSGGRRPLLLQFNAQHGFVIGAWVGDSSLIAAVADLCGNILLKKTLTRRSSSRECEVGNVKGDEPPPLEEELIRLLYRTLQEADVPPEKVLGIGVAVCGITRIEKGTVVRGRYLPGWEDFPIQQVLEAEFNVPVVADGDTFMAVLGEAWKGAGQGLSHLVRVTLGEGIGCGILIDAKPYRGATGAAGEIGDLIVHDRLGQRSVLDKGGYLEEAAGFSSLVAGAQQVVREGRETLMCELCQGDPDHITPETVLQAALKNDQIALEILRRASASLGRAIANIISVLNPELVILGGEFAEAGPLVLRMVEDEVRTLLATPPPMKLSRLGRDAEIYGAISLALERVTPVVAVSVSQATSVV
jgi:predicted NBD/HSP70 family sugar kinase